MSTKESIAYHEAGHVLACLLTGIEFKSVTIKKDGAALGSVEHRILKVDGDSIINPAQFYKFFVNNFVTLGGLVSETLYAGNNEDSPTALSDFMDIYNDSLPDLPEIFINKYMDFLTQYLTTIFQLKSNWCKIQAIAEALLEKETLNHDEVIKVISKVYSYSDSTRLQNGFRN